MQWECQRIVKALVNVHGVTQVQKLWWNQGCEQSIQYLLSVCMIHDVGLLQLMSKALLNVFFEIVCMCKRQSFKTVVLLTAVKRRQGIFAAAAHLYSSCSR